MDKCYFHLVDVYYCKNGNDKCPYYDPTGLLMIPKSYGNKIFRQCNRTKFNRDLKEGKLEVILNDENS